RVYPISSWFSPQGHDLSRGLLEFADGKPIDREGARWLAIHGINSLGVTPEGARVAAMTFDERIEWVISHSTDIVEAARNPTEVTWSAEADDPWQFLAFCMEWDALLTANAEGRTHI